MRSTRASISCGVLAAVSILCLASCTEQRERRADPPPELIHPDLSTLSAPVRQTLVEQRRLLDQALAKPEGRGARAEAFGAMGILYHGYGLHQAALASYEHAHYEAPRDSRWSYLPAMIHVFEGRFREASVLLESVLALDDEASVAMTARLRLADALLELGLLEQAESHFQKALPDGGAWAPFGLGRIQLARGDYGAAAEWFEQALEREPAATAIHHPAAAAYRLLGDTERAQQHLELAGTRSIAQPDTLMATVTKTANDARATIGRGSMASAHGRYEEAVRIYREAVRLEPEDKGARLSLAAALAHLERNEEALVEFREALRLAPDDPQAHFHLASHLARMGSHQAATDHFERAVALDPMALTAVLELAQTYEQLGRFDRGLVAFERAIELDPQNRAALLGRASCLLALERHQQALLALERLVDDDPAGVTARTNLGVLLSRIGRSDEAIEQLRTVVELGGDDSLLAVVHFNLAVLLADAASSERASLETIRQHYEQAVTHDPDHLNAHANLGNLLSRLGDDGGAATHYARARALAPTLIEVRLLEAQALVRLGRLADAQATLAEGLDLSPSAHALRRALQQVEALAKQQ